MGLLKTYLQNTYFTPGVLKISSLKDGIAKFWQQLTPDKCKAYIMHIHRVILVVLAKQGEASGF